jgi:drug/metabolite transporter (DMT)-like permease
MNYLNYDDIIINRINMQLAIIGLLVTTLGSVSTAVGWALQKQAFNYINSTDKSIFKQKLWWIGFVCIMLTQPLYIIGISMVNQSTIGVVGPFSLIANMLLAQFYLNEPIKRMEIVGVSLFIPGCILTL